MAYKDEYEVARLYSDGEFAKALKEQFDGDSSSRSASRRRCFATRDKVTGHLRKREFGAWMFRAFELLARFKFLRGTAFDPFGYTAERRMERALVERIFRDDLPPSRRGEAAGLPRAGGAGEVRRNWFAATATSRKRTSRRQPPKGRRLEADLENSRFAAAAE